METIEQIKIDEGGYQAEVYLCSEGKFTWLYGRNIEDRPITNEEWGWLKYFLSVGQNQKEWASYLFQVEIEGLVGYFNYHLKYYKALPKEVKNIILNMGYNIGTTNFNHHKWPKFFRSIRINDWKQAAKEGRDSKWFHQVGQRSVRLMNSLENVNG